MAVHAIELAQALIQRPSITPEDAGCQDLLEEVLTPLGFTRIRVDRGKVTNSIFYRPGERKAKLAFAGHTDVVPPGPEFRWRHPPFSAAIEDGFLFGRGAQDMKSSIACFVAAASTLIEQRRPLPELLLLITSDEEGESIHGTACIVEHLAQHRALWPDAVLVGEPSSLQRLGDTIRRGRRGVVQAFVTVHGKQGHSAYPDQADNAAHRLIRSLARVLAIDWGAPAEGFPPTSCEITNLSAGCGAVNVIPGTAEATIDVRYNPALSGQAVEEKLRKALQDERTSVNIQHQAEAFAVDASHPFLQLVADAVRKQLGITPRFDTGGGTSDARFFAARGIPVCELGPTNDTIHQASERIAITEIEKLTKIYQTIIEGFAR